MILDNSLSIPFLNSFIFDAFLVSSDKEFQQLFTLFVKKFLLTFVVACSLKSFNLEFLVWLLLKLKKSEHVRLSILWIILYVWIRSALICLYLMLGNLNLFSLSLYVRSLKLGMIFVNLLCTFSINFNCLFYIGCHITLAYSKWGLTIDLYNFIKKF